MNLKVPYYVKENFHTEHQGSMRRLEMSVEEDYIQNLRQACYREKNYSKYSVLRRFCYFIKKCLVFKYGFNAVPTFLLSGETLFWKARNFGDRDLFEKAQNMRLSNCEQYQNLQGVH